MALADNKAKIQALIAGINALPDAGSGEPALQEKSVTPTKSAQNVTPDSGYDGLSKVTVNAIPDEYIVPSGTVSITENGTHNVREAESVNVAVAAPDPVLQTKSVTPTKSAQTVTPDSGYDGLSRVSVAAIPSQYVTTTDATAEDADLTEGKTAYSNGVKLTGTNPYAKAATDETVQIQATKLAQLKTILEGKAAGGGGDSGGGTSVETCTVTVNNNSLSSFEVFCACYENNTICQMHYAAYDEDVTTIENVVVGHSADNTNNYSYMILIPNSPEDVTKLTADVDTTSYGDAYLVSLYNGINGSAYTITIT